MKAIRLVLALLLTACSAGGGSSTRQMPPGSGDKGNAPAALVREHLVPTAPVAGSGPAGSAGPFHADMRQAAAMPLRPPGGRVENDAETRRVPNLDLGRFALSPVILHPAQSSANESEITPRSRGSSGTARGVRSVVTNTFNESGQIDIAGSTDGTYVVTIGGNGNMDVWTLGGGLVSSTNINSFFCSTSLPACAVNPQIADARVLYDMLSNRWVITAMPIAHTYATPVFIAASTTSNPTGSYYLYQIASCGPTYIGDTDQPHAGTSSQWLVVSVPCNAGDPNLTVLDKGTVYGGGALALNSTFWQFLDPINVGGGNRDLPVLTYAPTINNRQYLVASGITSGNASAIYSHVEGTYPPVFYSGTQQVNTTFAATGPVAVDAPGCQGCINTFANGWVHSAGVWTFNNGQAYIVSTVSLGDPRIARSAQVIEFAVNTATGASTAFQFAGGIPGAGPIGSEIAMPLVSNTTYNAAMIVYARSRADFYPGVFAAQWNIDGNYIATVTNFNQGTLTPTGFDASRWIDFMQAVAPVPGSSQMVAAGPVASTYAGDTDPQKLVLWTVFTP
ncbi:MAG: hypothetical protein QOJ39_1888 [Candidatus Eremiobacteraeota bacterium]|jgi:hypothetical protein|nr:hypothetical protein [Candidatus Eremiobacteraeota bacterium]